MYKIVTQCGFVMKFVFVQICNINDGSLRQIHIQDSAQ